MWLLSNTLACDMTNTIFMSVTAPRIVLYFIFPYLGYYSDSKHYAVPIKVNKPWNFEFSFEKCMFTPAAM